MAHSFQSRERWHVHGMHRRTAKIMKDKLTPKPSNICDAALLFAGRLLPLKKYEPHCNCFFLQRLVPTHPSLAPTCNCLSLHLCCSLRLRRHYNEAQNKRSRNVQNSKERYKVIWAYAWAACISAWARVWARGRVGNSKGGRKARGSDGVLRRPCGNIF